VSSGRTTDRRALSETGVVATETVETLERELALSLERFTGALAHLNLKEAEYWAAGAAYWLETIKVLLMSDQEREDRWVRQGPPPF
jgi:hypothetical protein